MLYLIEKRNPISLPPLFSVCLVGLILSACGPSRKLTLKGLDVGTSQIGSTTYVKMEASILMGNLQFPNVEVPVMNPSTLRSFGQMSLQHLDDGSNRISVLVDYTEATKLDVTLGKTLPNEREIPVSLGAQTTALAGIPVLEQSRIYIGGDLKKSFFIGVAVAIPAFDSALRKVQMPLNIFFGFPFLTEVSGIAGFFTGPQKGQNGVAVFAKKSTLTTAESIDTEAEGNSELQKLDRITLLRLNHLLNKHAIIKVK